MEFVDARYKELAKLYAKSHICFTAYWYQGFPTLILEPMACGTAVVASGLGIEDVCQHEENSLIVPPRNPECLADAIIRLIQNVDLAKNLAKKGVETAQRFTWEKSADTLEQIINQTVKHYTFKGVFLDIPELISGKFRTWKR